MNEKNFPQIHFIKTYFRKTIQFFLQKMWENILYVFYFYDQPSSSDTCTLCKTIIYCKRKGNPDESSNRDLLPMDNSDAVKDFNAAKVCK